MVRRQAQTARGRVERGEQFVLRQHIRAGESIEQGRFAGVGVADDRGEGPVIALPRIALGRALAAHDFEVARNVGDAILHPAAVGFQLRFTFTAAHADAALLPRQVAPEPRQARQQMLQLRQLDLELALACAGALGEDVQNERRAVEDLAVKGGLQVAALRGGQLVIEDNGIDIGLAAMQGELLSLAFPDVSGGAGRGHLLYAIANDFAARGGGQLGKFLQ